jgi:uncharacterized membrane protein YadS
LPPAAPTGQHGFGLWAGTAVNDTSSVRIAAAPPSCVVLLGTGLRIGTVLRVGAGSLPVLAATLTAALGVGLLIGRALGNRLSADPPTRTWRAWRSRPSRR